MIRKDIQYHIGVKGRKVPREEKVRDGGRDGEAPAAEGDQAGALDVGQREDVERAADGEVALQGKGENRQYTGIRGAENIHLEN